MKISLIENLYVPRSLTTEHPLLDIIRMEQPSQYDALIKSKEFDLIDAARSGYHIITVAFIGLTNFSTICQYAFDINQPEQELLVEPINNKMETGTLYPKHNLTILPYRYRTSAFMTVGHHDYTDGKGYSGDEIKTHIKDAIEAETSYIKSNKLVFDFRDFGTDIARYNNILLSYLTADEYKGYDWEVYMFSSDNSEWSES